MIRSFRVTMGLMLGLTGSALAQTPLHSSVRIGTSSFIFARYATVSSSSIYAAYSLGPVAVVVGMVNNPRSDYHELIGGLVTRIAAGSQGVNVAIAEADASDGQYLQTYLVPSLRLGGIALSGTIEWYEPMERRGTRQLDINPITLLVKIDRRIDLGAAYTLGLAEGAGGRERLGPALRVAIPGGALSGEVLRNLLRSAAEVRLGLEASF